MFIMGLYIFKLVCLVTSYMFMGDKMTKAKPIYTDQELIAIMKFRELVKDDLYRDYMKSDAYLVRWLRNEHLMAFYAYFQFSATAKEFNLNDAAVMLRKAMKWRKDNKIDGILDQVVYEGVLPFFSDGIDNEGSVVLTIGTQLDARAFVVGGKGNVLVRKFTQEIESLEQNIMRNIGVIGNVTLEGNGTDLAVLIVNLQGYNLRAHACFYCFRVYFAWYEIYENFYPGYSKHTFLINTPRIFVPLLDLIKQLMSPQTRNAIKVYGQNKAEWQPAIIGKIVPADQVRAAFGGTKAN